MPDVRDSLSFFLFPLQRRYALLMMLVKELSRAGEGSSSSSTDTPSARLSSRAYTIPLRGPRLGLLCMAVIHSRATRRSCRGALVIDNQDEFTLKQ